MQRSHPNHRRPRQAGFTLLELIVAISLVALLIGIVAPNLAGMVPTSRLDGSATQIKAQLTFIRSEARIQAKRMELEFDLDNARFRTILPPEERLTVDQVVYDDTEIRDEDKDWIDLERGVVFHGAGDAKSGTISKGLYKVVFDEFGFTGDQVIGLQLDGDDSMIWTVVIKGLTGHVDIERSEIGELAVPVRVGEGAF